MTILGSSKKQNNKNNIWRCKNGSLAGVDLPREKRIEIGLTYIYGIGLARSQEILKKAGINPDIRVKDLTDEQVQLIRNAMEGLHSRR